MNKLLAIFLAYKSESVKGRQWWRSKTIWANVFSVVGLALAQWRDITITAEQTGVMLAAVNVILRLVSKGSVGFYEDETTPR